MLGIILDSILQETKALFSGTGAQVMLKTNFLAKQTPDNNGTFVLLDLMNAPDSLQYLGGLSMLAYDFGFNSYSYEPDAYVDDNSGFSTGLLDFIDTVRQHFTLGPFGKGVFNAGDNLRVGVIYKVQLGSITYNSVLITEGMLFTCLQGITTFTTTDGGFVIGTPWFTQGMVTIFNDFGFAFTLTGITNADALDQNGLIMGYKIGLISTALDSVTLFTENDITLQTITQINNPPQPIS